MSLTVRVHVNVSAARLESVVEYTCSSDSIQFRSLS
jgi:hypothetical protein